MQFSILDINWNDTFVESEMTLLKLENIDFKFDPETTLLKNK